MTLGVSTAHRRRGLGTRAMREIIDMLRERTAVRLIFLHVKTENEGAVAFYQARDERDIGRTADRARPCDAGPLTRPLGFRSGLGS